MTSVHGLLWSEGVPGQFRCSAPQGELFILCDDNFWIKEVHWQRGETFLQYRPWGYGTSAGNATGINLVKESGTLWLDTDVTHAALVTDKQNLAPLYRLDIPAEKVQEVHELDESGADTGLVLGQAPQSFALLDNPTYIATWVHSDSGQIEKITMPRLGLEFNVYTVNGERRAYCPRFPGWYVPVDTAGSRQQFIPALGKIKNSMLLYKDLPDGTVEKQVIIPGWQLTHGKPLAPTLETDTVGDLGTHTAVYRYRVDEESGEPIPLNAAGALHLASYYLHQRDYNQAIGLMHAPGIEIGKLDKEQVQLIITLTKMPEKTKDFSPLRSQQRWRPTIS